MQTIIHDEFKVPSFKREYRLYSFVNFYLSSIQQGIQTGHAAVDLVRYYTNHDRLHFNVDQKDIDAVAEWADHHKTFVILNGGDSAGIDEIANIMKKVDYPWMGFCESEGALNGILTTIAVVLPDEIFNLRRGLNIHGDPFYSWNRDLEDGTHIHYLIRKEDPEFEFVDMLKSKGLAR